jgi:NADH oxidase (H2O-forming)
MRNDRILEIKPGISWIGALDPDIVTFDIVMETRFGTTYNSYYINAEKKTIIETVKDKFRDLYLKKLSQVTDPSEIEYIVFNHTEPDHSGSLKNLLKLAPKATVVGSGQALNYLREMIGETFKSLKVKDGDIIDLGNKTLRIIGAPNLHWPDTIYTYLEEDKLLFTCDSFGAHFCHEEIFDDKVGDFNEAFIHYFNVILKPFSKFMLNAIEKIRALEIDIICTGHGPVLRSDWKRYVDLTESMASKYLEETINKNNRVLIAFISAYGYTGEMANKVAEGLKKAGDIEVELIDIENIPAGDLEAKVIRSNALIIGSPTINQNTLLPVYRLFSIINPIRDKGKLAAAFGSYGWSGEAVKLIEDHLKNLKFEIALEGLSGKFYPANDKAEKYVQFGKTFGEKLLEKKMSSESPN